MRIYLNWVSLNNSRILHVNPTEFTEYVFFFKLPKKEHQKQKNGYILSGSDFDLCRFTSFCQLPRGRPTASEMTCHVNPGRIKPPCNMLLSDSPPVLHRHIYKSLNLLTFLSKTSFTSVSPTSSSICPAWWGLVWWWMATACHDWHTGHSFRPHTWCIHAEFDETRTIQLIQ